MATLIGSVAARDLRAPLNALHRALAQDITIEHVYEEELTATETISQLRLVFAPVGSG